MYKKYIEKMEKKINKYSNKNEKNKINYSFLNMDYKILKTRTYD